MTCLLVRGVYKTKHETIYVGALNCILSCYDYLQDITVQILQVGGDSGTTFQWERNDCFHPESVTKRALPPR